MNRIIQRCKYLMVACAGFFLLSAAPAALSKQPNFLLVMADDMGWTDIGSFGSEIDTYYRAQLTPEIQVGPTLSVIFDPVRNPDEDRITVWGFRTRINL